jgi:hypothetical protein
MPIHDWTRISPGGFHTFHQDWTIEIGRTLNRGLLPSGYAALTGLRVEGWEPHIAAIRSYVNVPLESTYQTSWRETPRLIRDRVEAPPSP